MTSTTPIVEFDAVTKLYGTVIGLNDFCVSLEQGAYGLLGPNGAGKSTMLNLLTGQLVPTAGRVRVMGGNPRNNAALMSRIGFCPGFEGLYSSTTGLRWVTFLLQMNGWSAGPALIQAEKCLELTGMKEGMHRPIAAYSRGMRQRTKLAQAIAHEPEFLILDEPLSGLDPVGRAEMTDVLKDWVRAGRSLIIASHVLHEIEALTNSFLLICGGRLLASGTAEEIHELMYDTPRELEIECSAGHLLGGLLMQRKLVTRVQVTEAVGAPDSLTVTTPSPATLAAEMPELLRAQEISVSRLKSEDGSLNELFNSLMKIHRGER